MNEFELRRLLTTNGRLLQMEKAEVMAYCQGDGCGRIIQKGETFFKRSKPEETFCNDCGSSAVPYRRQHQL